LPVRNRTISFGNRRLRPLKEIVYDIDPDPSCHPRPGAILPVVEIKRLPSIAARSRTVAIQFPKPRFPLVT